MKGGKKTTEKRLRRQEEELKVLQAKSGDTPLGLVEALDQRKRAEKSAHIVLTVGGKQQLADATASSSSIALRKGEEVPVKKTGGLGRVVVAGEGGGTTILDPSERRAVSFGFKKKE